MKILTNILLGILIVIVAYSVFYKAQIAFGSTAGTTLTTSKIAEQIISTATDTQMAITNTDTSDRTITSAELFLSGGAATTSLYTVNCATSTVATGLNGSTNYILSTALPVTYGTTTNGSNFYFGTSSPGLVGTSTTSGFPANYVNNYVRVWKAGSTLVCKLVNSGTGQNNLFDPSMVGFLSFSYKGN